MTFPSSCAPLAGISRARLPARRCPTAGRRGPTVNRCWRTRLSRWTDCRIDPDRPADSRPVGLAGALTLPGPVEPHAHLDKTFTIERCRPAQAGCWRRSTLCTRIASTGPGGYSTSGVRCAGRAAANGVTHLRSHIDWFTADAPDARQEIARLDTVGITERVALVPLTLFRDPAQAEAIARTVATSGEGCLLGGFIHSSNWDAAAMANLLDSAARWELDLDLHIDEELSEVSQGLTRWRTISPATLFPGISAAATAARWPLAATNRRRRSCASWRRTASPLSLCR